MPSRIDEIRERWAKATPGPWETLPPHHDVIFGPGDDGRLICKMKRGSRDGDARAIAHAPDDLAYLLDLLDELRPHLSALIEGCETLGEHPEWSKEWAAARAALLRLQEAL